MRVRRSLKLTEARERGNIIDERDASDGLDSDQRRDADHGHAAVEQLPVLIQDPCLWRRRVETSRPFTCVSDEWNYRSGSSLEQRTVISQRVKSMQ